MQKVTGIATIEIVYIVDEDVSPQEAMQRAYEQCTARDIALTHIMPKSFLTSPTIGDIQWLKVEDVKEEL